MIRSSSLVIISLLTLMSCKVVDDDTGGSSQTVSTYRIAASEISGWSEVADGGWVSFSKSTMNSLVDGEYKFYVDGGMVEGAQQTLKNTSNEVLKTWVLDFSSKTVASQMFQMIKTDKITTPMAVTGFDEAVAQIENTSLYGCVTYAVFGQYIFCLSFSSYNDKNEAFSDAAQFLKVYQKR
jgi:hypothetical protein